LLDENGNKIPFPDPELAALVSLSQVIYMGRTPCPLGTQWGFDVILPYVSLELDYAAAGPFPRANDAGFGDLLVGPFLQWDIVRNGGVGDLRTIQSFFSYYNIDPRNIRHQPEAGGGALMDIGCYCISLSRWLFQDEPQRVLGVMEADPEFGVDRLTSGVLAFEQGTATFTCGTQLSAYQQVNLVGTRGRVEIEFPFGTPPDEACRLWHHTDDGAEEILVGPANHYTLQGDLFSQAVLAGTDVPTPLEDAVGNMAVIDAIVRSAKEEAWVMVS